MKPAILRPSARADRQTVVRYYRREAGAAVAANLVGALSKALRELERHPAIGSPGMGQMLGIAGLRTWRLDGFALSYWYFEEVDRLDVARLVGHGQDPAGIALNA